MSTDKPATPTDLTPEERGQAACRVAHETYEKTKDWVVFFREILGVDGLLRRVYPTAQELADFQKTPEYAEIQQLVIRLRNRHAQGDGREVTRVITVRIPSSLHEFLKAEAHDRKTSINQLCIDKLLQALVEEEEAPPPEEK